MANFYEAFAQGQANGLERQKAVNQRNMLAELQTLAPQVMAGDLDATSRAYALNPQTAQAYQSEGNRQQQQLVGLAKSLKQYSGNPQMQAGLYRSAVPYLKRNFGAEIPDQFDETTVMPIVEQVLAASQYDPRTVAANPYSNLPADIQSLRLLQENPALAQLDRERRQASGMVPKLVQTQEGYGWGTPGAGIALAPMSGIAGSQRPGGFGIAETDNYVRNILGKVQVDPNASPEQQAAQLLPALIQQESGGNPSAVSNKGAFGLTQVMPATGANPGFGVSPLQNGSPEENVRFGRDYLTAMLRRYPGRPDLALAAYNAGPAVADRFAGSSASNGPAIAQPYQAPMTPYQASQDSRADRAESRAEQAAAEAAEDRRQRREEKVSDQRRAVESAVASYDDALGTIQRLRAHPGFRSLGTIAGDAAIAAPLVRNDAKGANALLETIRNQSLINTLSALKAASSTGASGFGSLTEKEGAALQGAITNLQTAQSHEDLDQSLRELERVITRNRGMAINKIQSYQQPQAGGREPGAQRTIVRRGTSNGRPVVQFSDGTIEYGN